jgi:hypothetical protein
MCARGQGLGATNWLLFVYARDLGDVIAGRNRRLFSTKCLRFCERGICGIYVRHMRDPKGVRL